MIRFKKVLLFLLLIIISSLTIHNVKADTNIIEITDVSVKEKSGTITVVDPVFVSNEISSNITFNQKDDFVTFELTLKNLDDSKKYKVVSLEDNNTNNNISLEYSHDNKYISKDETTKVSVKLKYKNQLVNVDKVSLNDLTIKINLVNEDGDDSSIIINPVTGDHFIHYLILAIMSLIGLIIIFARKKKSDLKLGALLIIFSLIVSPITIFAYESINVSVKFTDIDIKGEFEIYNITIDSKNCSDPIVKQITYGQPIGELPADPTKDAYTFDKWVDGNGNTITPDTVITGPIEVSAKYNPINYTISYDLKDGSLPQGKTNPTTYNIESDSITLENPVKEGYTFSGWTGTGLDGLTTSVTIPTGSKENRSYTANYSPSQSTKYTVTHKYQNYDLSTFTNDVQELTGATGSNVTPEFKPVHGFNNPDSTQTIEILPDGSAEVVYIYERKHFDFEITDRTYIDEEVTTPNNSFLYETPITIKAYERAGYDFEWSDGNSNYERTFDLNDDTTLNTIYTPRTDTHYRVNHYKAKLNGDFELADYQDLTGTTGSQVTPANNEYNGFIQPGTITDTINGDGSTEINYYYTRVEYAFEITDRTYIDESVSSQNGNYPYESVVTIKAEERQGYTFKWSDNNTDNPREITITGAVSLTPIYTPKTNTPYVVNHYKAKLNGDYELADTDELTGTTGSQITPDTKEYTGFIAPQKETTTIAGNGSTEVNYYYAREEYAFEITDRTYADNSLSTPDGSYPYETQVRARALERPGYDFEWSDGETEYDRTITLTGTLSLDLSYTAKTNIPYKVEHYKAKLNGDYELAETQNLTGTTDAQITPDRKTYTGFIKPAAITTTINGAGTTVVQYYYERDTFTLTVNDYEYVNEGDISNDYPYETVVTLTAINRPHYTFSKWSNNVTDNPINLTITEDTTIGPVYTRNQYTITYNANGGTIDGTNIEIVSGGDTITLPTVTPPTGKELEGWYNESNVKVDNTYVPNASEQITAHYEDIIPTSYNVSFDTDGGTSVNDIEVQVGESIATLPTTTKEDNIFIGWFESVSSETPITEPYTPTSDIELIAKWQKIICKKATSLDTEICSTATGGTTGCSATGYEQGDTITYGNIATSDTIQVGDAYDCNVDGTSYNKRFYYLRTDNDKAVLIYSDNTGEGITLPNDPYSYLPTTANWSNLTASFDDDRVARFPSQADLMAATGKTLTEIEHGGAFDPINFIFENTSYAGNGGRSTVWVTDENDELTARYHKNARCYVAIESNKLETSENNVRPVIELPLIAIEDAYVVKFDPNGGTLANQYARVKKGSSLSTLPVPTKTNSEFDGWYTALDFNTAISTNTIPNSYATYYAKWIDYVDNATLQNDTFTFSIGDEDNIVITNLASLEPLTFESGDENIVTVDSNGHLVAVGEGHTLVIITGTSSNHFITVDVTVSAVVDNVTVTFDSQGGSSVNSMDIPRNGTISPWPSDPALADNTFKGWYTDTTWTTEVTNETVIDDDITLYARWMPNDTVCEMNKTYYSSISAAISATTSEQTTIILLKNQSERVSIPSGKDIILDLNNYTLSNSNNNEVIVEPLNTDSNLYIKNGTLTSTASGKPTVDNKSTGTMTIDNVNISSSSNRSAIWSERGTVTITGGSVITGNNNLRSTIISKLNGSSVTLNIVDATITSSKVSAIYNSSGTVNIGVAGGVLNDSTPVIKGENYGIVSNTSNIYMYDGIIEGKTAPLFKGTAQESGNSRTAEQGEIDDTVVIISEPSFVKALGTDGAYSTYYLEPEPGKYLINFEANGGEVSPASILYDEGETISSLPTPTKGVYTFTGWFYDEELENPVTLPFTITSSMPLYAGWSYNEDPTPVVFNMTNSAMKNYFNNIGTWKNQYSVSGSKSDYSGYTEVLDSSQFQVTMRTSFDSYSCSNCGTSETQNNCDNPSQGVHCDLPEGYNTGVSGAVDVYEYDSSNDTYALITYTTSDNGIIYNMIPGKTYKWVSSSDSNVYGYVEATASSGRRTIYTTVRNVRDLGGMAVSFDRNNTTKTGTIKYGKLYRGAKITSASEVTSLTKLGITREVDLRKKEDSTSSTRLSKHDKCDSNCGSLTSAQDIIMTNYLIYPNNYSANYDALRETMKYVMQSVVDGDNIYFHCTIGTDRTGTLAYFLEGLLGVSEEDKLEDYELSYFFGLLNRTRFHDELSTSEINPRFTSMYKTYDTNEKIYDFYMYGLTDEQIAEENVLIEQFRDAMIDYNN